MSTLKTGALRGTSGTADSVQLHASNQSVTFPGDVTCSGTATGFGGGKILQVKYAQVESANSNEQNITAHNSWEAVTQPELTITPSASGNKIILHTNVFANIDQDDSGDEILLRMRQIRTQSGLGDVVKLAGLWYMRAQPTSSGKTAIQQMCTLLGVDTTINANAITYKLQVKMQDDTDSIRMHIGDSQDGFCSTMIAYEVASGT